MEPTAKTEQLEAPTGEDWNAVEKVILERRSVRKYKDKQVPENLVRRVLEAGRFAPSAGNSQPWKFIVIRDRAMIDDMERHVRRLCKLSQFFIDWRTSPLGRTIPFLFHKIGAYLLPNMLHPIPTGAIFLIAEGKLTTFHGAPTVILILKDKRGAGHPDVDIGCCGQNMVLAAHSLGLGSCWVGFVEMLKTPGWKKRLGVSFPYEICEGIALGYPVGHPDGMIPRELQEVDWFEGGEKKVIL